MQNPAIKTWHEQVEPSSPLEQGDYLLRIRGLSPASENDVDPDSGSTPKVNTTMYNAIVLSQSCDLAHGKLDQLLMCPVVALKVLGQQNANYTKVTGKNELRDGHVVSYHLLFSPDVGMFGDEHIVANFRSIFTIPFAPLVKFAYCKTTPRFRLLPPYREHLSQAFARFIMRVGLPSDIPKFLE